MKVIRTEDVQGRYIIRKRDIAEYAAVSFLFCFKKDIGDVILSTEHMRRPARERKGLKTLIET